MKKKIGIYGGTFDPPHIGHKRAVEIFSHSLSLDYIYVIPAKVPPHKDCEGRTSHRVRYEMTQAAFASGTSNGRIIVSDIEMKREGKSYTSDTLSELSGEDRELYFLCGSDMFLSLPTWHRPDIIFSLAVIVCAGRYLDGESCEKIKKAAQIYEKEYGARTVILRGDFIEISSTEIREKLAAGENVKDYVSDAVLEIIKREELYK